MRIIALNGSPKGDMSITLQYVKYLAKHYPRHQIIVMNVAQKINRLEKNSQLFKDVIDSVKEADLVLWSFPVYFLSVPAQFKRFVELIYENNALEAFQDKYAALLSTSAHFFDVNAHNYMRGICDDLNMRFLDALSVDSGDLFKAEKRGTLLVWAKNIFDSVNNETPGVKVYPPITRNIFKYMPGTAPRSLNPSGKRIVITADIDESDSNISKMVNRLKGSFSTDIDVINIREIGIRGGCLGCLSCSFDKKCVYEDRDDFYNYFNKYIRDSDIFIMAGAIKDRYLSAYFKTFLDRQNFLGYQPAFMGKQVGYILSGPLNQIPNLRQILEAMTEVSRAKLVDIVTDEQENSMMIDAMLQEMARKCILFSQEGFTRPRSFLGIGGHKIFRDMLWSRSRFPYQADFHFYESNSLFDFPQNETKYIEYCNQMNEAAKDPQTKEMMRKSLIVEMVKPYQKIVETK